MTLNSKISIMFFVGKRTIFLALFIAIFSCFIACKKDASPEQKTEDFTSSENIVETEVPLQKTVVILATGGTIAGSGEQWKATNYKPGVLSVESLVAAVPGLDKIANIQTIQVCNVNSDDITAELWIELADKINTLAKDKNVAGFVITHGTDTMEETAYFLNLTVKTEKPVVLTGSMRPATSLSADGPMNLYQAVCVASDEKNAGKGVLVVFSDMIYSARSVQKNNTFSMMAISSRGTGSIGVVRNNSAEFYELPVKKHTVHTEFSLDKVSSLPKVSILYFSVDSDPALLQYAAKNSSGLVIAGAGAGEFSEKFIKVINSLTIPVVISSRVNGGIITQDAVLCKNTVAANDLSPQKAAVLLRLALKNNKTAQNDLIRMFSEY